MSVPIRMGTDGKTLQPGRPAALFPTRIAPGAMAALNKQQYAVSPDGLRFLINVSTEQANPSPITVILNWHAP